MKPGFGSAMGRPFWTRERAEETVWMRYLERRKAIAIVTERDFPIALGGLVSLFVCFAKQKAGGQISRSVGFLEAIDNFLCRKISSSNEIFWIVENGLRFSDYFSSLSIMKKAPNSKMKGIRCDHSGGLG